MSTRSIIATPAKDGGLRGRWCHWDGYPSCRAAQIWQTVQELGSLKAARDYILKGPRMTGYWNSYMPPSHDEAMKKLHKTVTCPGCNGTGIRPNGEHWDVTSEWAKKIGCNYCSGTGRYANPARTIGWVRDSDFGLLNCTEDMGQEWVYILEDEGLSIQCQNTGRVRLFSWGGKEPDWDRVEKEMLR